VPSRCTVAGGGVGDGFGGGGLVGGGLVGGALAEPFCVTVNTWPAIDAWPTRAAPVFATTDNVTVPLALPDCPAATAIHASAEVADHAQPANVLTLTESGPPAATTVLLVRLSVNTHGAPAWLSCTVADAMFNAADRADGTWLAATVYATVPSPCPLAAPVIEIQPALLVAVHEHSLAADTLTFPVPPVAPNEAAVPLTAT